MRAATDINGSSRDDTITHLDRGADLDGDGDLDLIADAPDGRPISGFLLGNDEDDVLTSNVGGAHGGILVDGKGDDRLHARTGVANAVAGGGGHDVGEMDADEDLVSRAEPLR